MAAKKRKDPKRVAAGKKAARTRKRNAIKRTQGKGWLLKPSPFAAEREAYRKHVAAGKKAAATRKRNAAAKRGYEVGGPYDPELWRFVDGKRYSRTKPKKKKINAAAVARNVERRQRNADLRIRQENALNDMRRSLKADAYYDGD